MQEARERLGKIAPFMLRSGAVVVGRDRLIQLRRRLAFVLFAEDLSGNSREKLAPLFACPIVQALTSEDIKTLFNFNHTKVLGFRRSDLSRQAFKHLRALEAGSVTTAGGAEGDAAAGQAQRQGVETMNKQQAVKVAVLGASGIGKHHANWWNMEGANVCAFLGSSPESVAATSEKLAGLFAFTGRGYSNLDELLTRENPDIVDVCTPPEWHHEHARKALQHGCHVLCEKPFVYARSLADETMVAQARELIDLAASQGRRFGVCTQYILSARDCFTLWRQAHPGAVLASFRGHLVSPIRGRSPNPMRTWVDLAPHMLGALRAVEPEGDIDWDSLKLDFAGHRARAVFTFVRPDDSLVACDIHTDHRDSEPRNVRCMSFNDELFDVGGSNDAQGVFQAEIHAPGGSVVKPDFMRLLIRDFLAGRVDVTGSMALGNLEWMLAVLAAARRDAAQA